MNVASTYVINVLAIIIAKYWIEKLDRKLNTGVYGEYTQRRYTDMGKKGITKQDGIQIDIYGNPVHVLNVKDMYRMVKCGGCGESAKSSQTKLHLSFGNRLNLCKKCLEEMENKKRANSGNVRNPSKIGNTIESYVIGPIHT